MKLTLVTTKIILDKEGDTIQVKNSGKMEMKTNIYVYAIAYVDNLFFFFCSVFVIIDVDNHLKRYLSAIVW